MNSSSIVPGIRVALLGILTAVLMSGCYLLQTLQGEMAVLMKREPIPRVIDRPQTPAATRLQLQQVTEIRNFASSELGLPDNGSYRSYADVGRQYVVWNVFAAPEFSVQPKEWCYPIAGCVAYRGYFAERRARTYAATLRSQGMDVEVGGVAAYSTLGHFDDPILNTMLGWDDVELASIIFHELTHQLLYVAGDSSFNEALATMVEEEGVRRWLLKHDRSKDLAAYELEQRRVREVIDLLRSAREKLRTVYRSGASPAQLRQRKQAQFAELRAAYDRLQSGWGGHGPFAGWFRENFNNAYLVSVATYYRCVPGFQRELALAGGDLAEFYRRARKIAKVPQAERDAKLCDEAATPAASAPHAAKPSGAIGPGAAGVAAELAETRIVLEQAEVFARGGEH